MEAEVKMEVIFHCIPSDSRANLKYGGKHTHGLQWNRTPFKLLYLSSPLSWLKAEIFDFIIFWKVWGVS